MRISFLNKTFRNYFNLVPNTFTRNSIPWKCSLSYSSTLYCHKSMSNETDPDGIAIQKLYRQEKVTPTKKGYDILRDPSLNKGMAFTLYERQYLGMHGLLPPAFMTEEQQAYRIMTKLRQTNDNLEKYIQLSGLLDRNEKLFFRILCDNIKELMPIVYTPTVGQACQAFGFIYRNPRGVYITSNDNSISKIHQILSNCPHEDIKVIVVTDGERILGLGDLGAYGMGIPIGKLTLYTALAGIKPSQCLPVLIDVGTDNQKLLNDPFYIGLRHKRIRGKEYDKLLDNFMNACVKKFGQNVLIQFEDFGNKNAYRLLDRYRDNFTVFNDDIQGTASVVLAGLLSTTHITKKKLSEQKFVFLGAGGAGTGVAEMCVWQMESEGLSYEEACNRIYLMDIDGLITKNRLNNLPERHIPFAKDLPDTKSLLDVINTVQPNGIIGASTVKGAFTPEIITRMAEINPNPIIFALSNPTSKAECTAEDAYRLTKGNVLFASGSPFPNLEYNGKIYKPGQGNNAYIFPSIGLAVCLFKIRHIKSKYFLIAARCVAKSVTQKNYDVGRIYPRLKEIREISIKVAIEIAEEAYKDGLAALYPKPKNLEMYIRSQLYDVEYEELINKTYEWPEKDCKHGFPVPLMNRDSMDD
ncbi:NAD-dependent malic enzyme, mitochondrial [Strongyloides ratti]|uniref:Malic enzyme n=1 Tax=Strongyloides ratti TaxID=34506 RepID=A0A090KXY7_STRRB|nr:NAD-dependent malic enzyme, mitochondrial [Strongyloides ratti]CEF62385.1 NAD-dependent malic enzyme, mitochondrial [Strongyloides ratti]